MRGMARRQLQRRYEGDQRGAIRCAQPVRLPLLEDIIIGLNNSTFILDGNAGGFMARNVLAYEGARIV